MRRKWRARSADMMKHKTKRIGRDNLETFNGACRMYFQKAKQFEGDLRTFNPNPRRRTIRNRWYDPQVRCGDDPNCPLRTGQQLRQIIAAIIFFERGKPIINPAIGQHSLNPKHKFAHRAKAQHLCSARIRRDQTANCR